MALLDPLEDIRAARANGDPLADPAKLEKLLKAAMKAICAEHDRLGCRRADMFMLAANLARVLVEKLENEDWDLRTAAAFHKLFVDTLARNMARNLVKRKMPQA